MKTLKFEIDCGETTCASAPGKWCMFLGQKKFGLVAVCLLFRDSYGDLIDLKNTEKGGTGWTLRCQECIEKSS